MLKRVRLGRARQQLSRTRGRESERIACDALDTAAGENSRLLRELVRRSSVHTAADAAILAFRVLTNADDVDVSRRAPSERRRDSRQQTHRTQVDVLHEPSPQRKQKLSGRNV